MTPSLINIISSCSLCNSLGINCQEQRKENLEFAYSYLPEKVKILWIVESPPLSNPPRYFYRPELTKYDSLFREVMKALNIPVSFSKESTLRDFQERGHFLIDSMKCPADKNNSHLKPQIRYNCKSILKAEIFEINPNKILVIKKDVYEPVFSVLREIQMENPSLDMISRILNKTAIPFPGWGQKAVFRKMLTSLLKNNDKELF